MMIWEILSIFGDIGFWLLITVISIILFIFSRKLGVKIKWFILKVLPSVLFSRLIVEALKQIFKVPRPCLGLDFCPTTYSFPSGHATVVFAAMTALAFHYEDKIFGTLLLGFATLSAFARLMLGVHRLEDVIVGSIIGIVTVVSVLRVYENYQKIRESV